MTFKILGAILTKDALSHAAIVVLVALLFLADALIERVDRVITHGAAIPRSGMKLAGL